MKPWSACGTNSVPISGTSAKLPPNRPTAIASTVFRRVSAHSSVAPYTRCIHSMNASTRSMKRPSHGTRRKREPGGSCQTDDSIGSSVKLTNSDTITATATVTPNWKKKRPMMPLMNAIGTNTATIANVVAITASPISSVPSRAAVLWSFPIARCRTMFSRTTIASSMRRPMHSDSAIRVRKLSEKPNA